MSTLRIGHDPSAHLFPPHSQRPSDKASLTSWIAVLASMIGAFMAILNIQITNASLLDIEGGIGTGIDNGAWISTSYLIGEIVVIPLTDYLSRVFSFRRYMLANAILFPLFSMACAFTHDLGSMIVMRGLQGFAGGILIPMAFTMVLTKLPKPQQPIGLALFALSVTFAPAIGPTIGGYLTENLRLADHLLRQHAAQPRHGHRARLHAGAETHAARAPEGRGTGPASSPWRSGCRRCRPCLRKATRTTGSPRPSSSTLSIVAAVFLAAFIAIELTVKKPLVNLRLLKRRNFGIGVLANVLVGFALFGTVYILPQYLGQVQRYNAEQIGNVLAWTGLPQLLLIPLVPLLLKRFDARHIGFVGISIFAASCFMNIDALARHGRRSVLGPEYRPRHRPGPGADADQHDHHGRHRPERGGRGLGPVEHAAQSRRRGRHRDARDRADEARAIPFEHHRPVGDALSRRGAPEDQRPDALLHGARRDRSRSRRSTRRLRRSAPRSAVRR